MAAKFPLGEIVQLKSGGPAMTISELPDSKSYSSNDKYVCQWFKGASKERGTFIEEELQLYVAPKKA